MLGLDIIESILFLIGNGLLIAFVLVEVDEAMMNFSKCFKKRKYLGNKVNFIALESERLIRYNSNLSLDIFIEQMIIVIERTLNVKAEVYSEHLSEYTKGKRTVGWCGSAILINERYFKEQKKIKYSIFYDLVETICHEFRHEWQHQQYDKYDFSSYIRPEDNYVGYYNQPIEVDAREWASRNLSLILLRTYEELLCKQMINEYDSQYLRELSKK